MRKTSIIISLSLFQNIFCQQSLTIWDVENLMQKNNLQILAEQYNISAAQATVVQARIWDQPYFSAEINALNPDGNKVFDIGSKGQKVAEIQQLIFLGGKRKNEINFAKNNEDLAKLEFEQLVRNLKHELNVAFYSLYFESQKLRSIENQIQILDSLVRNYSVQVKKGNISLREVVRLQSLMLNLKNAQNETVSNIIDYNKTLSLLTGFSESIIPIANEQQLISKYNAISISKDQLIELATQNNIEIKITTKLSESQELFLKWQKSLAIPNLTAGISYDQRGGAFQNQVNMTIGIPLPLWNRNKGNILVAESRLNQSKLAVEYKNREIEIATKANWKQWTLYREQWNNLDQVIIENLESVYMGMVTNFQKRNVSMIEFTDFMESYNESFIQINEFKKALIFSGLNLVHITNSEIF